MNWYKIAQKIQEKIEKRGLKPEDLFFFYSIQSLSSETFVDNPDILYDFIELINSTRKYYLDFLVPRIVRELGHSLDEPEAMYTDNWEIDEEAYSFSEWLEEEGFKEGEYDEDQVYSQYVDFMEEAQYVIYESVVGYEDEEIIEEIQSKLSDSMVFSNKDFDDIIFLFKDLPWSESYGGLAWAIITKWTKKLYFAPKVNISGDINSVLQQARNLVYILDTLHSLHHNNALALSELPNGESQWITGVLEVAKYAREPLFLSYFADDTQLAYAIYKEVLLNGEKPKNQKEFLQDMLIDMPEYNRYIFLRAINYDPIVELLLTLDVDLIKYLILNPRSVLVRSVASQLFKKLIEKNGLEKAVSSLPVQITSFSSFIYGLPMETRREIQELYEKGLQPNYDLLRRK